MALLLFLCQVTGCTVSDPVTAAVQASASLHPRRGWCGSRSVSYSEHRSDAQNTFPSFTGTVHLRQSARAKLQYSCAQLLAKVTRDTDESLLNCICDHRLTTVFEVMRRSRKSWDFWWWSV